MCIGIFGCDTHFFVKGPFVSMIEFNNVTKYYKSNVGLENVTVHIKKGDFVNSQKATILFDNGMFNKSELSAAKQDIENYLKAYHADKI